MHIASIALTQELKMGLVQRNGIWQWRKMIDGVMLNRSTKTDDKMVSPEVVYEK